MIGRTVLLVAGVLMLPSAAEAQRCVRGKPCGNTCISRDKVCRVGRGTARAAGGTTGTVQPRSSIAGTVSPRGIGNPGGRPLVTEGMSQSDVRAAAGEPDRSTRYNWYYGTSIVGFDTNGRVTSVSDPTGALNEPAATASEELPESIRAEVYDPQLEPPVPLWARFVGNTATGRYFELDSNCWRTYIRAGPIQFYASVEDVEAAGLERSSFCTGVGLLLDALGR